MDVFLDKTRDEIIEEIAQTINLDCTCYFEPSTKVFVNIPTLLLEEGFDGEENLWEPDLDIIKDTHRNFIIITCPEPYEVFKYMEGFVASLSPSSEKQQLENMLLRSKPFRNFNNFIHNAVFRDDWFTFKNSAYFNYVKAVFEAEGI